MEYLTGQAIAQKQREYAGDRASTLGGGIATSREYDKPKAAPNSVMEDLRLRGDEVAERLLHSIQKIENALDRFYGSPPPEPIATNGGDAIHVPGPALARVQDVMSRLAQHAIRLSASAERLDTIA